MPIGKHIKYNKFINLSEVVNFEETNSAYLQMHKDKQLSQDQINNFNKLRIQVPKAGEDQLKGD